MKQVYRLFKKSYRIFWKDKVAVLLTFIVPLVLMSIFGSIFGGSGSGAQGIRIAVLNQSSSPVAKRIEHAIDTTKAFFVIKSFKNDSGNAVLFDTVTIKEYVRNGSATAALVLPPDAYADTSTGLYLKFYYDPKNEIEMQMTQGLVRQIVFGQFPSIIAQSGLRQAEQFLGARSGGAFNRTMASVVHQYFGVDTSRILHPHLSNFDFSRIDSGRIDSGRTGRSYFENIVRIEGEQLVGKEVTNPWATRSVGGWAMTFLLFTLTAAASSLFDEKSSGVLLRILTSPVSRAQILWSKYLFNTSLGVIQLLFMFLAGWALFHIDIFTNFFNLLLIIIAAATACTAFGMLLAAFSHTRSQSQGLATLFILSMSAVGGAWFPVSFMPATVRFFSKLTVVYWAMEGFLDVLWRGVGIAAILPHLGVLIGIAALLNAISLRQFKRGKIFQ